MNSHGRSEASISLPAYCSHIELHHYVLKVHQWPVVTEGIFSVMLYC